jgi:hypothetical protein
MEAKNPISIAMRPSLVVKIDQLALIIGQSRSETVSRLMNIFVDDLLRPKEGWVRVNRNHLINILKI